MFLKPYAKPPGVLTNEPGGQIWVTPERMHWPLSNPASKSSISRVKMNVTLSTSRFPGRCGLPRFWSVTAGPFGIQFTLSPQGVGREAKSYFALLFLFLLREKV